MSTYLFFSILSCQCFRNRFSKHFRIHMEEQMQETGVVGCKMRHETASWVCLQYVYLPFKNWGCQNPQQDMWLSVGHHRLHRVSKPQRRGKNASAEESGIPQRAVYRVETMWLGFTLEDARRIPMEWSRDTPSVIVNLKRVLYICQNNKCEEHTPWQDEVLSFCSLPNWLEGLWFNSSGQWIQDVLDVLVTSCYILYIYIYII